MRKGILKTANLWEISCKTEYRSWKERKEDGMELELREHRLC
jgi:hypothetical protein